MTLISDFIAGRSPPELYETYLAPGLFSPFADDLLARLPPSGTCLDIACGTGVISRKLARNGAVKRISAIDIAEPMIAHATALAANEDLADRIEYSVASALDLPFAKDEFETAYCQQGVQFFPDRLQALREARRVLKPGGRFAAAVWTAASDGNPVFGTFEEALARRFGEDLVPLGPFAFGDKDALQSLFEESGFTLQSLERREANARLPDIRSFILFDLIFIGRPGADGALQPIVAPDDPAADEPIREMIAEMEEALSDYVQDDNSLLAPMTTHIAIAKA
ncbi:class I SAM-dependent methyltransferase [Parasphingopyxis sp.]|uniref:class I SAM-dependent methyltransferase n=1 Tax=Parasphingopyxis sp. TaxID=1920299 RepID=UPI0026369453|nr:class I SAM-dependent methyltransferase [Parasphingopyxis sp.]